MKKLLLVLLACMPLAILAQPLTDDEAEEMGGLMQRYLQYGIEGKERPASGEMLHPEKCFGVRIYLRDKAGCGHSTARPEEFLSTRAIERRKRMGVKVDEHDLPVSQAYLQALRQHVDEVKCVSKWLNTAVVMVKDTACLAQIDALPFVTAHRVVYESPDSIPAYNPATRREEVQNESDPDTDGPEAGAAYDQLHQIDLLPLHEAGFRGKGVLIAVIDGGFHNADYIAGFTHLSVVDTKNFVRPSRSVYAEQTTHGTNVLACITTKRPYELLGSAPEADVCLYVSEDGESEFEIEEDYWVAAIERADSVGADLTSTSLGYHAFDNDYPSHTISELDGQTTHAAKAGSLAASRGLLCVLSAGNEGDDAWHLITTPADSRDALTVGAVYKNGTNTGFSSLGPTVDGRIKPDVMARGGGTALLDECGNLEQANGTSFSCPVTAGAVACLMQACPNATIPELIHAIQQSGNFAAKPNNVYGFGIPSFEKARQMLTK